MSSSTPVSSVARSLLNAMFKKENSLSAVTSVTGTEKTSKTIDFSIGNFSVTEPDFKNSEGFVFALSEGNAWYIPNSMSSFPAVFISVWFWPLKLFSSKESSSIVSSSSFSKNVEFVAFAYSETPEKYYDVS